jgi:hypothetical protein
MSGLSMLSGARDSSGMSGSDDDDPLVRGISCGGLLSGAVSIGLVGSGERVDRSWFGSAL